MRGIKANTPGIDSVVLSAHCHNDLGQAASNTLMGEGCSLMDSCNTPGACTPIVGLLLWCPSLSLQPLQRAHASCR